MYVDRLRWGAAALWAQSDAEAAAEIRRLTASLAAMERERAAWQRRWEMMDEHLAKVEAFDADGSRLSDAAKNLRMLKMMVWTARRVVPTELAARAATDAIVGNQKPSS